MKHPPWISYCEVEDRTIILDVRANRYFLVRGSADGALRSDGPLARSPNLQRIIQQPFDNQQSHSTASRNIPAVLEHSAETGPTSPVMSRTLKAGATITLMRFQLAAFSLDWLLCKLQRRNRAGSQRKPDGKLGDLITAFECAERLIVERDRCLLRSLALQAYLAKYGHVSALVFGVRLHPFRAHCWLQQGSTVLNDTIEVIGSFHPLRTVA